MQGPNTEDWFKVETIAGTANLARCYYWIQHNCKGKFQVWSNSIMFENHADAVYFGIGYK